MMLKQTRIKILLSVNAAVILIAGVLIANAIWTRKETSVHVISEQNDVLDSEDSEARMINSSNDLDVDESYSYALGVVARNAEKKSSGNIPLGELWNETYTAIYQSADKDICVDSSLSGLGDMYWQTSNTEVISGFYASAREKLGYSTERCRFPKIVGTGTTTITAGTYDGLRRDKITVTVIAIPTERWKHEVLTLVNQERTKRGLSPLSWGSSCEEAAQIRATEIISKYSHTRPDGSSWNTACPIPSYGGSTGENLAAGNTTTSPASVVATWMASDTHRANILNEDFTNLAIGFVFDPNTTYRTYWSQIFSTF